MRKDSAGQENVYATEVSRALCTLRRVARGGQGLADAIRTPQTKAYTKRDRTADQTNAAIAGIAGSLAITAIAIGLLVTGQQQPRACWLAPPAGPGPRARPLTPPLLLLQRT